MSETKQVYAVWSTQDLTEGKSQEYIKHFCECEATARRLAKKRYVQGTDAPITTINVQKNGHIWYGPIFIEPPTEVDKTEEKNILRQREMKKAKEDAIEKARALGLTDKELRALRYEHK